MPGAQWKVSGCAAAAAGIDFAKAKRGSGASVAGTDVWSVVDLSSEAGGVPAPGQRAPPPVAGAATAVRSGLPLA